MLGRKGSTGCFLHNGGFLGQIWRTWWNGKGFIVPLWHNQSTNTPFGGCSPWNDTQLQCIVSIAVTLCTFALTAVFSCFFVADNDNLWRLKARTKTIVMNYLLQPQFYTKGTVKTNRQTSKKQDGREFVAILWCSNSVKLPRLLTQIYAGNLKQEMSPLV